MNFRQGPAYTLERPVETAQWDIKVLNLRLSGGKGMRVRSRWLTRLVSVVGVVLAVIGFLVAGSGLAVASVRVADHGDKTRFVVDLPGKIPFHYYTTDAPDRIIADLPTMPFPALEAKRDVGLVRDYHFEQIVSDKLRIVLDLKRPATVVKAYLMRPEGGFGWRFVVDLVNSASTPAPRTGIPSKRAFPVKAPVHALAPPPAVLTPAALTPVPTPARDPVQPPAEDGRDSSENNDKHAVPRKRPVVILDAGHGGVDPGTKSISGIY
ncbi:MAG: AMIN domain-containing protein, partial [Alphaproteobacteria bacterium]|nr:AMIN domain-containing protein [Alphaproteobacteria bacterium]